MKSSFFKLVRVFLTLLLMLSFVSCIKDDVVTEMTPDSVLSGGTTTIFSSGPDAFTFPLANLTGSAVDQHFEADGLFEQQFVTAPAMQFGGVGPLFNQNACIGCHVRNGRGTIPQFEGDHNTGLLLRISVPGVGVNQGIVPVPGFGGQLQSKAIFGTTAEGQISKSEMDMVVAYADGIQVTLKKPTYTITDPYIPLPSDIRISPRNAPPVHGLGLLEAIPESTIMALADEGDGNGDGISGKANLVWDVLAEDLRLGRFGWKAEQPTAEQQAADAAHNDMGLTNFYFPTESCDGQENCTEGLQSQLDADDETTHLFAFYFQTLAVPAQRNYDEPAVISGKEIFNQINCNSCHTPQHVTGEHEISELSNQIIYPYTDMLLHDMGDELSDNRPVFSASGNEWRTPPLWGLGLTKVVNPNGTFMHDGRANTIEEAIIWHGGEASESANQFKSLSVQERSDLIAFLNSL